jgi:hypothetical protein
MDRKNFFYAFEFNNNLVFNQEVNTKTIIKLEPFV